MNQSYYFDAIDNALDKDLLQAIMTYRTTRKCPPCKVLIHHRSGGKIDKFVEQKKSRTACSTSILSLADSSTMKSFFIFVWKDVRNLQKYIDHLVNRADGFSFGRTLSATLSLPPNIGIHQSLGDDPIFTRLHVFHERPLDDLYSAALSHLFPPTNQLARNNFKVIFTAST